MDDRELEALLSDLESDRVERKSSLSDKDRAAEAICAFANDLPDHRRPGVVFIGVRDDGSCAELAVTDKLLKELADFGSNSNLTPFPSLVVRKERIGGCEMAVIQVQPSDAPPVRFRGRVFVRVGPTTRIATAEDERRLNEKRRFRDLPFDLRPVPHASFADLDLPALEREYLPRAVAPEVLEANQRSLLQQLASLRLVTVDKDPVPTVLGVLVSGIDPTRFVPGAYIQFVRFEGTTLADPVKDSSSIGGPLSEMLNGLKEKLKAHVSVAVDIASQAREVRLPDYPLAALHQLVYNAALHRSYEGTNAPVRLYWFSDRIEIHNPGGPFGQVTRANFGAPGVTDYRNPHLAEAMKILGFVQKFGVGIQIARSELASNGNPPLEYQVEDSHVLAIIRRRP